MTAWVILQLGGGTHAVSIERELEHHGRVEGHAALVVVRNRRRNGFPLGPLKVLIPHYQMRSTQLLRNAVPSGHAHDRFHQHKI